MISCDIFRGYLNKKRRERGITPGDVVAGNKLLREHHDNCPSCRLWVKGNGTSFYKGP